MTSAPLIASSIQTGAAASSKSPVFMSAHCVAFEEAFLPKPEFSGDQSEYAALPWRAVATTEIVADTSLPPGQALGVVLRASTMPFRSVRKTRSGFLPFLTPHSSE